jgi:hypothetical protein
MFLGDVVGLILVLTGAGGVIVTTSRGSLLFAWM